MRMQPADSQWLERHVLPFFSGRRYVLLTTVASMVAMLSIATRMLAQRWEEPPDAASAEATQEQLEAASSSHPLLSEALQSRLSILILAHGYLVALYYVFRVVANGCFRRLRTVEVQQTKEMIIHFVLVRCLLLASTMGPIHDRVTLLWLLLWLSAIGFLRGMIAVSKARFEHLVNRPAVDVGDVQRVAWTLCAAFIVNLAIVYVASISLASISTDLVRFTWFEAALLTIKVLQLGVKVAFYMLDNDVLGADDLHDRWSNVLKLSDNIEMLVLGIQTGLSAWYLVQLVWYYLYIVSIDQFRVSFLDFILILNVKNATVDVLGQWRKLRLHYSVLTELDEWFEDASTSEVQSSSDDVCVICLKPMINHAKKLRCGHLFHRPCLRQCVQRAAIGTVLTDPTVTPNAGRRPEGIQQQSKREILAAMKCAICRKPVIELEDNKSDGEAVDFQPNTIERAAEGSIASNDETQTQTGRNEPEVIRFTTEWIAQWIPFPTISFEIIRHQPRAQRFEVTNQMIGQVGEMFPQIAVADIRDDLARTHSPERTIENILTGRLTPRPEEMDQEFPHGVRLLDPIDDFSLTESFRSLWEDLAIQTTTFLSGPRVERRRTGAPGTPEQQAPNQNTIGTESLLRRLQRWRGREAND